MTYIERPTTGRSDGCDIFVDLPAENQDEKNLILYRGETGFVILNAYPYTSGHLLVAPYRQVADIVEMTDAELLDVNKMIAMSVKWIRASYSPDGFNIGVNMGRAAGAGIPQHIHWHVVPRWSGDSNFMTTVGQVRVIPQTLEDTYRKLFQARSL